MAIFNEIGKKISQGGHIAVSKTKDMADVVKLNSSVSAEERNINDIFAEIGKKYYEMYAAEDKAEEVFQPFIQEIRQAYQRIDEYKAQLQRLKKLKTCPACGAEVSELALVCEVCGMQFGNATQYEQPEPVSGEGKPCPHCGKRIEEGDMFCIHCGEAVPTEPNEKEAEPQKQAACCKKCGEPLIEGNLFCGKCGTRQEE